MGNTAIKVEGLGKRYLIGAAAEPYYTFRDTFTKALKAPWRRLKRLSGAPGHGSEMFWALKDVSFEVEHGEVLGIIGRNGAGKSTLLKILSRITRPTVGRAEVYGRVGSLLEVGTGFHPELTGRENIFLNGAVLGMRKREIERKFDEIVDFSGIERFLDTAVKRYSSGMAVRLGFSIAAHLDSEVLLVDEALAVGDAEFRTKCYSTIRRMRDEGKSVLFVTHQLDLVTKLCDRAMLISKGCGIGLGSSQDVVAQYMDRIPRDPHPINPIAGNTARAGDLNSGRDGNRNYPQNVDPLAAFRAEQSTDDRFPRRASYNPDEHRFGDFSARLVDYLLAVGDRFDPMTCNATDTVDIYIKVFLDQEPGDLILGLTVLTMDGVTVCGANTLDRRISLASPESRPFLIAKWSFQPILVSGIYYLSLGVARLDGEQGVVAVDRRFNSIILRVLNDCKSFGISDLQMNIEVGV